MVGLSSVLRGLDEVLMCCRGRVRGLGPIGLLFAFSGSDGRVGKIGGKGVR